MALLNCDRRPEDKPVSLVHDTEDGMVHLLVVPDKDGGWRGTIFGKELACARRFDALGEANSYVAGSFWQMFPEHRCCPTCGPASEASQRREAAEKNFHSLE